MRIRLESFGVSLPRRGNPRRWTSLKHATVAGDRCMADSRYRREDVEVLINAGLYRDKHYAEPAFAVYIQDALGINVEFRGRQTLSFDLQNGGTGLLSALHVLHTMMQSGEIRCGMAVASEVNADKKPLPEAQIIPSGAAILLDISPDSQQGFGAFVFQTHDDKQDLYAGKVSLAHKGGQLIIEKDPALEQSYLDLAPGLWNELLAADGRKAGDFDLVLASQISTSFIAALAERLGVSQDKIVDVSTKYGDTLTTSPFLALHEARARGLLKPGTRVAFLTFGSGISLGAASCQF